MIALNDGGSSEHLGQGGLRQEPLEAVSKSPRWRWTTLSTGVFAFLVAVAFLRRLSGGQGRRRRAAARSAGATAANCSSSSADESPTTDTGSQQLSGTLGGGREKQVPPGQPPRKDKGAERLKWWSRLNECKPALVLPQIQEHAPVSPTVEEEPEAHRAVSALVEDRVKRGKDWLVRDSDYGTAPAHASIKEKVNEAFVKAIDDVFGAAFPTVLAADPRRILLVLDAPQYGTLRDLVNKYPQLRCSQQVVIPQADLGHYFEQIRTGEFYPGVRAQRLDHWMCANSELGLQCHAAFFDYECRLAGAISARLCPAADVMRYFRFGYPADPVSIFAITVGLEDPAPTVESVDEFVRWEASLNGYVAELLQVFKYRMATLLYIVRRPAGETQDDSPE